MAAPTNDRDALLECLNSKFLGADDGVVGHMKGLSVAVKEKKVCRCKLFCFKYRITAKWSDPVVRLCRGAILSHVPGERWVRRSFPFTKFFNATEKECQVTPGEVAAEPARFALLEKADGTCIQVYCVDGTWMCSTLGAIDTGKVFARGLGFQEVMTFAELFQKRVAEAAGCPWHEFTKRLDRGCTHLFELCDEANKIITEYPTPRVYYLASLANDTGLPSPNNGGMPGLWVPFSVSCSVVPRESLESWEALSDFCDGLDKGRDDSVKVPEGFVLYRDGLPVAKIKHKAYLAQHNLYPTSVVELFFSGKLDDVDMSRSPLAAFAETLRAVVSHEQAGAAALAARLHESLGNEVDKDPKEIKKLAAKMTLMEDAGIRHWSKAYFLNNHLDIIKTGVTDERIDAVWADPRNTKLWVEAVNGAMKGTAGGSTKKTVEADQS